MLKNSSPSIIFPHHALSSSSQIIQRVVEAQSKQATPFPKPMDKKPATGFHIPKTGKSATTPSSPLHFHKLASSEERLSSILTTQINKWCLFVSPLAA